MGRTWPGALLLLTVLFYSGHTQDLPNATLTVTPNSVYPGETVSLRCSVESDSGWTYRWFKGRKEEEVFQSARHNISGDTLAIRPARRSDQDVYRCGGEILSRPRSSAISDPEHLNVLAWPNASLTVTPNPVYYGKTVSLRCSVKSRSGLNYRWFKGTGGERKEVFHSGRSKISGDTLTIIPVKESDQGVYRCRGEIQPRLGSPLSDPEHLNVLDLPKPVLRVSPLWLNPGDSVTLSCDVGNSSTDWRFFFYRVVPYRAELHSLGYQHSLQLLSDSNGTTENSYTLNSDSYSLNSGGPCLTGGYMCEGGRAETDYKWYSEQQFIWSGDRQSSVSLSVSSNRSQHFHHESLSLSCEFKDNSTVSELKSFTDTVQTRCLGTIKGSTSTCPISPLQTSDSGVYWCESDSGEFSNAVNITVHDGPVILESPVHPVTEGDSVTLHCKNRTTLSNHTVDFYKDGELIRNKTTGEMTIPAVSKSDQGLYKCQYSDSGQSPESWLVVTGNGGGLPSVPDPVNPLVVGLVLAGSLLVIFILLLLGYQKVKGSWFGRSCKSPQSQSTNQNTLQMDQGGATAGAEVIYEEIGCKGQKDKNKKDSASGPRDVTYSQIEIKNLGKPRRKTADTKVVYSAVTTNSTRVAAGPRDVTYSQIEIKNLGKPRRKTADTKVVYSAVATGSTRGGGTAGAEVIYEQKIDCKGQKAKKKKGPSTLEEGGSASLRPV